MKNVYATGSLDFFRGDMPDNTKCKTCEKKDTCSEYTQMDRYRGECAFRNEIDVLDNHQVLIPYVPQVDLNEKIPTIVFLRVRRKFYVN